MGGGARSNVHRILDPSDPRSAFRTSRAGKPLAIPVQPSTSERPTVHPARPGVKVIGRPTPVGRTTPPSRPAPSAAAPAPSSIHPASIGGDIASSRGTDGGRLGGVGGHEVPMRRNSPRKNLFGPAPPSRHPSAASTAPSMDDETSLTRGAGPPRGILLGGSSSAADGGRTTPSRGAVEAAGPSADNDNDDATAFDASMETTRPVAPHASDGCSPLASPIKCVSPVTSPPRGDPPGMPPTARHAAATVSRAHHATPPRSGSRSTPATPPSHARLLPGSSKRGHAKVHAGVSPPGMPRPGVLPPSAGQNDAGSSSPISQFRRSLKALKSLGVAGIREGRHGSGHDDPSFQEASEEQEMAQIQALLQERSAARAEVQRLEREKEMQAAQLRLMEARMIDQELSEEEYAALEDELDRARAEAAALGATKEALEHELAWQLAQKEEWSQRLREAEQGERELTASAQKALSALAKKEAEAREMHARLVDLEREVEATREQEVRVLVRRAIERVVGTEAGSSPSSSDEENDGYEDRGADAETKKTTAKTRADPRDGISQTGSHARDRLRRRRRKDTFDDNEKKAASANCGEAEAAGASIAPAPRPRRWPAVFVVLAVVAAAAAAAFSPDRLASLAAVSSAEGWAVSVASSVKTIAAEPPVVAASKSNEPEPPYDEHHVSWTPAASDSAETKKTSSGPGVDSAERLGVVADVVERDEAAEVGGTPATKQASGAEATPAPDSGEAGDEERTAASEDVERSTPPWLWAASEAPAPSQPPSGSVSPVATPTADHDVAADVAVDVAPARADAAPSLRPAAPTPTPLGEDALSEEAAWESAIKEGWAAWRHSNGSDRRARVKAAARRAESAVAVAREGREAASAAARRHLERLAAVDQSLADTLATGADGQGKMAVERQRLTFEAHEAAAEESSARRKWEALRDKARAGVRVLEAEVRALGG